MKYTLCSWVFKKHNPLSHRHVDSFLHWFDSAVGVAVFGWVSSRRLLRTQSLHVTCLGGMTSLCRDSRVTGQLSSDVSEHLAPSEAVGHLVIISISVSNFSAVTDMPYKRERDILVWGFRSLSCSSLELTLKVTLSGLLPLSDFSANGLASAALPCVCTEKQCSDHCLCRYGLVLLQANSSSY